MLTIVPQCGLCNRLRVVLSAMAIAQRQHVDVHVLWQQTPECNAAFTDLFVPIDSGRLHVTPCPWWARPSRRRNLHWPRLLRLLMGYTRQYDGFVPRSLEQLPQETARHRRIYVSSCSQLAAYPPECLRRLQPREALQTRIDSICSTYAADTVGVHIRRTDNVQSMQVSTVEAFVEAMQNEINRSPRVRFFLATDDAQVKQQLICRFPRRIITQSVPACRTTLEGMADAVVDLWCLARTRRLLGSYWSSFTDTAAEIGQIPITIVGASNHSL